VTHGAYGFALHAEAGGRITAQGLTVETTADDADADAVNADGAGSSITLNRVSITTSGDRAAGLMAQDGAVINGSGLRILATGLSTEGAYARDNARIELLDSEIEVTNDQSMGVSLESGGHFMGTNVSVHYRGALGYGFVSASGIAVWEGGSIVTEGADATGVYGHSGSQLSLKNIYIETRGDWSVGVLALGAGTNIDLTDVSIFTLRDDAVGLWAYDGGTINALRPIVMTEGAFADGLLATTGSTVIATDPIVRVSGADAAAIYTSQTGAQPNVITVNGGHLEASQGPIVVATAGANSVVSINGPVTLVPGMVAGRPTFAIVRGGMPVQLDLNLTDVAGATGDFLVNDASAHTVNFRMLRSAWSGNLEADPVHTVNVDLAASRWTGWAANASLIALDAAGAWHMTGSSNADEVRNAGLIRFVPQAGAFSTLTVSNYVGQGGVLALNTMFDGDGSPSDLLVIDGGTATGSTGLLVTYTGGSGAPTVGDGIRVVQVINGGATNLDAFHLAGRVAAGAYEYALFRGGATSPEDWFLRTVVDVNGAPVYRPEVPLYAPVPALARHLGLASLGTLHERIGEQLNNEQPIEPARFGNGAWLRLIGEHGENRWSGPLDVRARHLELIGIQVGHDLHRDLREDGRRDHAGVYVAYTEARADIRGAAMGQQRLDVGRVKLDGPALGGYWTRFGPSGAYLDAVAQVNWFDVQADSDHGARLDTSGWALAASLEAGYPFRIGERWQLEPQAQIVYQTVSVDADRDAYSKIAWAEDDAVTGRVGARLQYRRKAGDKLWQPYLKVDLWHTFSGTDRTKFDQGMALSNRFGHSGAEAGAGITVRFSRRTSFYGHLDYQWSLGGRERYTAVQGAAGLRFDW